MRDILSQEGFMNPAPESYDSDVGNGTELSCAHELARIL